MLKREERESVKAGSERQGRMGDSVLAEDPLPCFAVSPGPSHLFSGPLALKFSAQFNSQRPRHPHLSDAANQLSLSCPL